jgi:hypothetical protein
MRLSRAGRFALIALGVLVVLAGAFAWGIESEYGGESAIENHQSGYLADGSVEIREIDWNRPAESAGSYEVVLVASDEYAVRWVELPEAGRAVMFTGSTGEIESWLDQQGPALFEGTRAEADTWLAEQKAAARNFMTPGYVTAAGILLVVMAMIPRPRASIDRSSQPMPPATPSIGTS